MGLWVSAGSCVHLPVFEFLLWVLVGGLEFVPYPLGRFGVAELSACMGMVLAE
jgi:hypothetical protein